MMKRFLSFTLDPALADPESVAFSRQRGYFAGASATLVLFRVGMPAVVERGELRVVRTGGASKMGALVAGIRLAFRGPRPDTVVAQDAGPLGLLAWFVARRFGAELLLQDHSGLFARPSFGWKERSFRRVSRWLYRRADRVRAVSERARAGLERAGVASGRITVLPIAADLARFVAVERRPEAPPLVVCVARLEAEKGIDGLLRAFAELADEEARLLVIGDGSCRGALETLRAGLGLGARVRFSGKGSAEEITAAFSRASAYVQPSRFEGWGMAAVEAAAAGLPIVMTDVGCAGELLRDREEALVVPVEAPRLLAGALDSLLADPDKANRLGARARRRVLGQPGPEAGTERTRRWLGIAA